MTRVGSTMTLSPMSQAYLDVIRCVAANLVLAEHAHRIWIGEPAWPMATVGVTFFFLISGFLIFNSALARFGRTGPQMQGFLIDRACRIYTAFLPTLVLVAIVSALLIDGNWGQEGINEGPLAFVANALMLHDYPFFQVISKATNSFDLHLRSYNSAEPFWTIPIEFWIYVGFAGLAFVLVRGERVGLATGLLLLAAAPVVLWNAFAGGGESLTVIWAVGALFGFLSLRDLGNRRRNLAFAGGLIAFGLLALAGRVAANGFLGYEVQTTLFMAMILFGLLQVLNALPWQSEAVTRAGALLASYSYSLYLVHNTVLIVFYENVRPLYGPEAIWAAVVVAHLVAIAVYLLFERHHKAAARYFKARLLRPGATAQPRPPLRSEPLAAPGDAGRA